MKKGQGREAHRLSLTFFLFLIACISPKQQST